MTAIPLLDRTTWERLSWHARADLQAARRAAVEAARAAHHARYHPENATDDDEPDAPCGRITATEVAAEIDWLHAAGTSPEMIARQLGSRPSAIERRMGRLGRHDLARLFAPLSTEARGGQCADCGTEIVHTSTRCATCARAARKTPANVCRVGSLRFALVEARRWQRTVSHQVDRSDRKDGADRIAKAARLVAKAEEAIARHEADCPKCMGADEQVAS